MPGEARRPARVDDGRRAGSPLPEPEPELERGGQAPCEQEQRPPGHLADGRVLQSVGPISGCANGNPASASRSGSARWPPRSISSPISPNAELHGEARQREDRRPMEGAPQRVDEVAVSDHTGGGEVVDALERMLEGVEVGRDDVVERDPAPPLRPAPDPAADTQAERQQHPLQRTAVLCEDDPLTEVHDPRARPPVPVRQPPPTPGRHRRGTPRPPRTPRSAPRRRAARSSPPPRRGSSAGRGSRRRDGLARADACRRRASRECAAALSGVHRWSMLAPARFTIAATSVERFLVDRARSRVPGDLVGGPGLAAGRAAGRRGPRARRARDERGADRAPTSR